MLIILKQRFLFFTKYALLWISFFVIARGMFLIYHFDKLTQLSIGDVISIFFYGLKMDISATGYILLIPGIILCASFVLPNSVIRWVLHVYTFIMAFFLSIITVVDFELFKHWGFRFDITPLKYLGKETTASSEFSTIMLLVIIFIVILSATVSFYNYLTKSHYSKWVKTNWIVSPIFLVVTALLIIPIRGGFGISPMNLGTVFFHKKNAFANHAAVNLFWNFGDSITKKIEDKGYPENLFGASETKKAIDELYSGKSVV